ncbi:response regulator [Nonomuraea sp. NPDC049684]|uniref:response regulator n=1 Tax=Nonomuraea sp. NPDC049684 TaxID=3364356 RepID=UPI0037A63CE2
MIRVAVVDDHDLVRAGFAAIVNTAPHMEVVAEAGDGEAAVVMAAEARPDVILMDIRMPGIDGVSAAQRILRQARGTPPQIIMLTAFDLDEYVYTALRAGAAGFLLKDTPPRRLLTAVQSVVEGDMLFAPSVLRKLVATYTGTEACSAPLPPALQELTARELEVLSLVGQALSNAEIAERLSVTEATVKSHLNRASAKLGLKSRAQTVALAYEIGLVVPRGGRIAGQ